ncbi:MAG: hypothetical protein HUJ22_02775 [Gracilimonas sp.]|uniref:hypothetical protein n=1 Tax=Gracilimonas sp. TaxID=1974203 RepID=UPI0019B6BDCD|nr:hypothetical protein [Gracilimonas sp.]MBD3615469.1 hypothetical protein [Gracilimonas sp.]
MKKISVLHIVLLLLSSTAFAQVIDTTKVGSSGIGVEGRGAPGMGLQDTTTQQREGPEPGQVTPWVEDNPLDSDVITNDSLMRWQLWPNWGDYQAYRRDVISFRQGTIGRIDAFHINGYEPHEQQLEMEGLSLNHPITGLPNYNLVPHRKIDEVTESFEGTYHSDIRIRDYYIVKPRSYLNYDEAGGGFRNLEFLVSQNFTEFTNLEVSYWDRRGGGYYPSSEVKGNQILGRIYHHLNERFLLRGFYLRNQLNKDESFGYNIGNPAAFPFDEFTTIPMRSNANSEFNRWDFIAGIYHRNDSSSMENAGLEFSITKNKHDLFSSTDTLSQDIRTLSANLFKSLNWHNFEIRGEFEAKQHKVQEISPISENDWMNLNADALLGYQLSDYLRVYSNGTFSNRSDGKTGMEATGGFKMNLFDRLSFGGSISTFTRMPSMQALYWQSPSYRGNEGLENESGISAAGNVDFQLSPILKFGVKGRLKRSENAVFLTQDSTFTNSQSFQQLSGTAFARFENNLFEIESSGTVQKFIYNDVSSPEAHLNNQDQIVWLRNSAFVKGYVFDRAAYLKLGVKTLLSPFYYGARSYNTELGYWQGNSTYQKIPPFFRLDGELSARVRGIMVVIRWENALDGYGQAGYFEAAGFPMPPRRLLVGIRAQFRN